MMIILKVKNNNKFNDKSKMELLECIEKKEQSIVNRNHENERLRTNLINRLY